jgi:biopolymer transport protein ExbB
MMNNLFFLLQVNVQGAVDTLASPGAKEIKLSYWDLAMKGGLVMIPIGILSILAVYIFIERYLAIRKASQIDANFMNRIKDYIHDGKIDSALSLCKATDIPIAHMIEKGISRIGRPLTDIEAAIENVGRQEIFKLEKGLPTLASAAGGAPMLGFLGTVTGMIRAFYNMAMAGNNLDIQVLSSGIYEAMVTTVAGLIVGIMGYFGYNILVASIEKLVNRLESSTTEFMDLLNEPVKH